MNMWVRRVLLGAALLAVGVWIWTVLFPSPERVIRNRLTELAKSATFGGNEPPVAVLLNSQKVAGFFTADVEIKVAVPGRSQQVLSGRDNLFQTTMQLHSALGGLQVDFYDIVVTVAPDPMVASMRSLRTALPRLTSVSAVASASPLVGPTTTPRPIAAAAVAETAKCRRRRRPN